MENRESKSETRRTSSKGGNTFVFFPFKFIIFYLLMFDLNKAKTENDKRIKLNKKMRYGVDDIRKTQC